jgi:hypothetical protein
MRPSTSFLLSLAATLLVGLLLVPRGAMAQTPPFSANCPVEPATNTPIVPGEVFTGNNCNLYTDGDIDSFTFEGTSGVTYQFAIGLSGGSNDICMTLYNPGQKQFYSKCTNRFCYGCNTYSVVDTPPALTVSGTYTIVVTEPSNGTQNYAVSLQQVYPFPLYAAPICKFDNPVPGNVAQLADTNFFTFPAYTTGTYQVKATLNGGSSDICLNVAEPNDASAGSGCTNRYCYGCNTYSVSIQFQPPQDGTDLASIQVAGNDGTQQYTFEVACVVGNCPPPVCLPPAPALCSLSDSPSYNTTSGALNLKFGVWNAQEGTTANWNAWLTDESGNNNITSIASESIPYSKKAQTISETVPGLATEGAVGVLSTLTTAGQGIVCSSWAAINPIPRITSLSPPSATAGAAPLILSINGTNFVPTSTVTYNRVAHTVEYLGPTELQIALNASDLATAGSYPVVVTNPAPGGGHSNTVDFTVTKP